MFNVSEFEDKYLSKYAVKSNETKGRQRPMLPCNIRTEFQRDRDRIIHSKAFRRLKHKTQVFLSPYGDHYRTRLTHTLEVTQIARTIGRALALNEDLIEAIALGHDLGHTPFGHIGESVLNEIMGGFDHSEQSLRVVDVLEDLNLTFEVRDGIRNHRTSKTPLTLEGCVVRLSDKIAYINHDIDDSIRAGVFDESKIPTECVEVLGKTHGDRIDTMVRDIVENSYNKPYVEMTEEVMEATYNLRKYLFKEVYLKDEIFKEETLKAQNVVFALFEYYKKNIDALPQEYKNRIAEYGELTCICDFIAGMTDNYAVSKYKEIFIPKFWK